MLIIMQDQSTFFTSLWNLFSLFQPREIQYILLICTSTFCISLRNTVVQYYYCTICFSLRNTVLMYISLWKCRITVKMHFLAKYSITVPVHSLFLFEIQDSFYFYFFNVLLVFHREIQYYCTFCNSLWNTGLLFSLQYFLAKYQTQDYLVFLQYTRCLHLYRVTNIYYVQ